MSKVFGRTKQAFYKQLQTTQRAFAKEEMIVGLVNQTRQIWKRGSGRNLHQCLKPSFKNHDIKIGRDKFFDVLRDNDLLIKRKRYKTRTTMSYHHYNKHSNIIRDILPTKANQIWVADITYLWLKEKDKFCYLSLITDEYSRKIVGHCVHEDLSVKGCLAALKEALNNSPRNNTDKLIHHSDRGVQYCCHAYTRSLGKNKITISMTETGDPLENAIAERINKTIKEEFTTDKQISFSNIVTASKEIKKIIDFYNQQRPHRSINWLTPSAAHLRMGEIKRVWKSYYKINNEFN